MGHPYSWTHHLRRAVAYALSGRDALPEFPEDADPTEDEVLNEVLDQLESHVICHSDCEGFYVPIDFPEPLYDDAPDGDSRGVIGGILGSSQGVLRELIATAPLLGIPLADGALSDGDFDQIQDEDSDGHPHWVARQVWLKHFEAARLSVEHNTVIVFH